MDSETEGVFTVGCAGGRHTHIHKEFALEKLPDSNELFKITILGLKGGHSGIDIHRQRANANKILGRALDHINAACDIRLVCIQGGTAHNAIPRDAIATIACHPTRVKTLQDIIADFKHTVQSEYAAAEKNLSLSLLYKQLFNREPVIEAIHAGLECAIIGSKYAGMDMISLGPTIENPHSPDERLYIPSIDHVWTFLVALLKSYGK